eukprot:jgi/Botrbrau1/17175/Bobra.0157s0066.1
MGCRLYLVLEDTVLSRIRLWRHQGMTKDLRGDLAYVVTCPGELWQSLARILQFAFASSDDHVGTWVTRIFLRGKHRGTPVVRVDIGL